MQVSGVRCEKCNWTQHDLTVEPTNTPNIQNGVLVCLKCKNRHDAMRVEVEYAFEGDKDTFILKSKDGEQKICPRTEVEEALGQMLMAWAQRAAGKSPDMESGA